MTMGTPADHAGWVKRANALKIDAGLFIDGASCDAASGAVIDAINPATGALITQMACGGAEDIDRAVASAKRAWDKLPAGSKITLCAPFTIKAECAPLPSFVLSTVTKVTVALPGWR